MLLRVLVLTMRLVPVCVCARVPAMTKQVLCMNPGPIEFEPRVLKAFATEGISHVDKSVIEVFGQCLEKMRKVGGVVVVHHRGSGGGRGRLTQCSPLSLLWTRQVFLAPDGQPLLVAGSGTLGWDMVGANLVNAGDDVLIINNGACR